VNIWHNLGNVRRALEDEIALVDARAVGTLEEQIRERQFELHHCECFTDGHLKQNRKKMKHQERQSSYSQ
jgi:hypothetical protein